MTAPHPAASQPAHTEEQNHPMDVDTRTFRLWAPNAQTSVSLELGESTIPMERDRDGWWMVRTQAAIGDRYGYRLDDGPEMPDPQARRLPDGPHGRAAVCDPTMFTWTDADWEGVKLEGSVIYEIHVGTFSPERTFDGAIAKLDHLAELGIDIVEVMPIASFPGQHGWGYDGVAPYSVHEPYGGPEAFARFVDACHFRGLAVALDVVYNHLGPDGNYLGAYGPYFTDRHDTPWGLAVNLDGPCSDTVRQYIIGNAVMWLRDYHVDALRLDAVHELHDERAIHLLEELSTEVDDLQEELGRPLWLIAESDRNDERTVIPRSRGGLGLDAQWADDVHHGLHAALTGEDQGYYSDFATPSALPTLLTTPFLHAGTWSSFRGRTHGRPVDPHNTPGSAFVASLQTHDQVGNRRQGERLSAMLDYRRLACGAALLLTSPYTPMLFMGEEWAASTPWQYFTDHVDSALAEAVRQGRHDEFASHGWLAESVPDPQSVATVENSTLNWRERDHGNHERMLAWYKALLALRMARPDLRSADLAAVTVHTSDADGAYVIDRGKHRVGVNLTDHPVDLDVGVEAHNVVLLALDTITIVDDAGIVHLASNSVVVVGPSVTG